MNPAMVSSKSDISKLVKHKRRYCKVSGCERIVKSQGLCQRHGAKPRKCKIDGCQKQAQGNFGGMCKSHFKTSKMTVEQTSTMIPPNTSSSSSQQEKTPVMHSVFRKIIPDSVGWLPRTGGQMPLMAHLKAGFDANKPHGWHRNEERRVRGLPPVISKSTPLEEWECGLVWTEALILTGHSQAAFRHLAWAWGYEKGFHTVMAQAMYGSKDADGSSSKQDDHNPVPGQVSFCVEVSHSDHSVEDSTASLGQASSGHASLGHASSEQASSGHASSVEHAKIQSTHLDSSSSESGGDEDDEPLDFHFDEDQDPIQRSEQAVEGDMSVPAFAENGHHLRTSSLFASFQLDSGMLADIFISENTATTNNNHSSNNNDDDDDDAATAATDDMVAEVAEMLAAS